MKRIAVRELAIGAFISVVVMLSIFFALGCVSSMAFAEEDNTPETSGTNEAGGADKAGGADGEDNAGTRGDASKGESIDVDPSVGQTYNVSDGNYVFKGDINPTNIVQDDYALEVAATNRETEVIVEGSVTDTDDNGKACGVSVSASGDNLTATADVSGNVTATGKATRTGSKPLPDLPTEPRAWTSRLVDWLMQRAKMAKFRESWSKGFKVLVGTQASPSTNP